MQIMGKGDKAKPSCSINGTYVWYNSELVHKLQLFVHEWDK